MENKTTREYFMKPEDFKYYLSLVTKINQDKKDLLKEIDDRLTREEQEYFVKNNRIARLQNSFEFEKKYEGANAVDINGYPADRIVISKGKKEIEDIIDNTGSDDIDERFEDIEDYLRLGATYTAYESYLIYHGYNVLHAHRDYRGDWGDDAGYMIIISEKDSKYHVHIPFISYNCDIGYKSIEKDIMSFSTKDEAVAFVNNLAVDMNNLIVNDDDGLFDDYSEYKEFNEEHKNRYPTILKNKEVFDVVGQLFFSSAFFEYPFGTLISMKHIESLNGYYNDYKGIDNLNDFRLYGDNRFDEYDGDIIIEIVD